MKAVTDWVFAVVLGIGFVGSASAQDPLGMVLLASGEVRLVRGEPVPARMGDLLFEGDLLVVESGSATFVFCPESRRYLVPEGASARLAAGSVAIIGAVAASSPAGRCSLPKVRLGEESLERVGGVRPRGKPPIEVYLGGVVSSPIPHFMWKPVPAAKTYRIVVRDGGGALLWEGVTAASDLAYGGSSLRAGSYSWSVHAERDEEVVAEQSTNFEVRPPAEEVPGLGLDGSALAEEEALLLTFHFENLGYPAEAALALRPLLAGRPDDLRLRRRLAWLYWKAGLLPAYQAEIHQLPTDGEEQ